MVTVCALVSLAERPRLEAAGSGCFATVHADSLGDVAAVARRARADAIVISTHRCDPGDLTPVATLVREFPALPTVALVSRFDGPTGETLLRLGATGIRTAIDCTDLGGWRRLRDAVGRPLSPVTLRIMERLAPLLRDASEDARRFFDTVARLAPALTTVRAVARHLTVPGSTLVSRFQRAGLPSPKAYLVGVRLLHVAWLLQNPGLSVADVAYRMDFSSPQSLGRHLRATIGLSASEFRQRFPFDVALERFVDLLITPYRDALRALLPLHAGHRDQGPDAVVVSRAG
jgi:AraC-like DNA-binding protein